MAWTGKINGVVNPAKINGIAVANIEKVMGIESDTLWTSHHANSDWEAWSVGSWDSGNSEWDSGEWGSREAISLRELGSWVESYRPSQIRVTFTGATNAYLRLLAISGDDPIAEEGNQDTSTYTYQSGEVLDITWAGFDIYSLYLSTADGDYFSITNIEFSS